MSLALLSIGLMTHRTVIIRQQIDAIIQRLFIRVYIATLFLPRATLFELFIAINGGNIFYFGGVS